VASPHDSGRVYQMDVFLHTTADGGETIEVLGNGREKHSDNHALWIDPDDPRHLLAGTDGGLYETFDHGTTWRHFGNLPISQFYKLAVDGSRPFYRVLAGAQDLGTLLGPARTSNGEGVRNEDWSVPMGADGYACAFDPEKPDLLYLEWQVGNLHRYDLATAEALDIQPQPAPGEPPERWNWDAPIAVSPHAAGRLYFGSQRLWRSDDRGQSWTPWSGDLTRGDNRYTLEMIDRVPSVDALYDNGAMSWYSTLTTVDESPLEEGLLYTGSDDGLIHVREGRGTEWRRAASPPGVPERAFVQELTASLHDADAAFAVLDAHKEGDFRPLLFESSDRGGSWRSIAGDPARGGLPAEGIVWSVVQDHVNPDLLFAGTEFGLFFTLDRGRRWTELDAGLPTIALRDLAIHRAEGDLVAASFGRGLYVLDDYSPLRHLRQALETGAALFPVRRAWSYIPEVPMQAKGRPSQGSAAFVAPNPPFGALLTYYLGELPKTRQQIRREEEATLHETGEDIPFPGWQRLREEGLENEPRVWLTVRDTEGRAVRRIEGPAEPGLHRIAWDLRREAPDPTDLSPPEFRPPWVDDPRGPLVAPGTYHVELAVLGPDGGLTPRGEPQEIHVEPLATGTLGAADPASVDAFRQETRELLRRAQAAAGEIREAEERLRHLRPALERTPLDRASSARDESFATLAELEAGLADLKSRLVGDPLLRRFREPAKPSILGRLARIAGGHWDTRLEPTATQRRSLEIAGRELGILRDELSALLGEELRAFEATLEAAGAPWTPGRRP
ncbi:MAG: hypothetical protein MI919_35065, partial [Holophagales bacterium]|nr:hypothetical protein [Holophagales bacterium]